MARPTRSMRVKAGVGERPREMAKRAAFARRAMAWLPEHLGERMDDLEVIMGLLPPGNRVRRTALEMLVHLRMQRRLQADTFTVTRDDKANTEGKIPDPNPAPEK